LFANLSGAGGVLFGAVASSKIRLSAKQRAMLADACAHLAVAYQLRELKLATHLADRIAAALAPSTRSVAREEPALGTTTSELMIDVARSIDWGSFGRRRRSPKEACELWRAVKSSEYTLLESVDRGDQRTIVAVRRPGRAGLTPRESAVARLAAEGLSNKWIGGELGISASTVAVHLSAAMRKLGCPSRGALVLTYRERSAG
jgi:DNA-binding CsgD family transcriptional regulator